MAVRTIRSVFLRLLSHSFLSKVPEEEEPEVIHNNVTDEAVGASKSVKEEMTEEDLEDWLDSMIS